MSRYASQVGTRSTPQSEPIPGKQMVPNRAGGFGFQVDDWTRLQRFLILGNEGGTFYATERELTKENAQCILRCADIDPEQAVANVVDISTSGRAPKNDPAVFAMAMLAGHPKAKGFALDRMHEVCRIGTHLFQWVEATKHFRGRGRAWTRAVNDWYLKKPVRDLCYQLTKYQQRDGWSHRDVLRLCRPKAVAGSRGQALRWAVGREASINDEDMAPIGGLELAKRATSTQQVLDCIETFDLVREAIPTEWLNKPEVWEALLEKMPPEAMVRNLGKMTSIGLVAPMSEAAATVVARLRDMDRIRKARLHPMAILLALRTYQQGHGMRGKLTWKPVPQVVDALDQAFYLGFHATEATGKNWLVGVDVSGSMSGQLTRTKMKRVRTGNRWIRKPEREILPLTVAEAAAAMSMLIARKEPDYYIHGFANTFRDLGITANQSLNDVLRRTTSMNFGRTDCALPMYHALDHRIPVDVFLVITDNETWAGLRGHPCQALQEYREKMQRDAKLIVMGMTATDISIADPSDGGMMDVVGFDTAAPNVMADFARGT